MKKFPAEFIRFIRKFQIEKYLRDNKLEYKDSASLENEQFILYKCPSCGSLNHKGNFKPFKLYISKDSKNFLCYVCGIKGSLLKLMGLIEKISIKSVINKYLNGEFVESIPDELPELLDEPIDIPFEFEPIELPKEFEEAFVRPQKKFGPAYKYWLNRGITRDNGAVDQKIAQALDVRYCEYYQFTAGNGKPHTLQKRLIFPVYFKGMILGYQGRDVTGLSPLSYYISEGLPKGHILYNFDRIKDADTITICEGIFDLIKCWNYNPVALFGKSLTNHQLDLLFSMPNLKTVILALDPDTKIADKNKNIFYNKVRDKLKGHFVVKEIELLEGKEDCGDHTIQEMDIILANSKPYIESELPSLLTGKLR